MQPGVRRGACVRALPCPRFRAAPTPPHSDAGHARLKRVHGHLRMDAPQDKARLQPPRHRSAGGGWGPGHGGTAQPISRAPPARSRGLRLRSPSCASRSAAPIVLRRRMAERHAQLERAAGGRDAVQLRQLARAQRGGAAGAEARRPARSSTAGTGPSSAARRGCPGSRARAASAQTDAAAPAARARPRGRPSRARGARARRAGRGCRRRPRRRAAVPAAPATHPIACCIVELLS